MKEAKVIRIGHLRQMLDKEEFDRLMEPFMTRDLTVSDEDEFKIEEKGNGMYQVTIGGKYAIFGKDAYGKISVLIQDYQDRVWAEKRSNKTNPRSLDFVRTIRGGIGMVTELSGDSVSIEYFHTCKELGDYNAWVPFDEVEVIDSLPNLLARNVSHPFGAGYSAGDAAFPLKRKE